jgi:hypothetical protein
VAFLTLTEQEHPMIRKLLMTVCLPLLIAALAAQAMALDQQEFDRILQLKMEDLTAEASALLEKKYSEEDWDAFKFPKFVFSNDPVETGYRIAVKEPEMLRKIPCYCFCDAMGHKSLLDCFVKDGKAGGKYDDHAVSCNICYGQAMLALLWKNAGASDEEIIKGMERKFEGLLKQRGGEAQTGG